MGIRRRTRRPALVAQQSARTGVLTARSRVRGERSRSGATCGLALCDPGRDVDGHDRQEDGNQTDDIHQGDLVRQPEALKDPRAGATR